MFQLHDLRESKVWQEAHQVGHDEGREEGHEVGRKEERGEVVKRMQAKGMTLKAIAELLDIPLPEVRRLVRSGK